jgi:hypothetical protein
MKKVFGLQARNMTLRGALQIRRLHQDFAGRSEEDEPDLSSECRYAIFLAGITGDVMPNCAQQAFAQLCSA